LVEASETFNNTVFTIIWNTEHRNCEQLRCISST